MSFEIQTAIHKRSSEEMQIDDSRPWKRGKKDNEQEFLTQHAPKIIQQSKKRVADSVAFHDEPLTKRARVENQTEVQPTEQNFNHLIQSLDLTNDEINSMAIEQQAQLKELCRHLFSVNSGMNADFVFWNNSIKNALIERVNKLFEVGVIPQEIKNQLPQPMDEN